MHGRALPRCTAITKIRGKDRKKHVGTALCAMRLQAFATYPKIALALPADEGKC